MSFEYLYNFIVFQAAIFIYHIFTLAMYFSYISFCNFLTNLYIRLPSENKPFSGFKLYVFLFGVFHTMVGVATVYITVILEKCVSFTNSYYSYRKSGQSVYYF